MDNKARQENATRSEARAAEKEYEKQRDDDEDDEEEEGMTDSPLDQTTDGDTTSAGSSDEEDGAPLGDALAAQALSHSCCRRRKCSKPLWLIRRRRFRANDSQNTERYGSTQESQPISRSHNTVREKVKTRLEQVRRSSKTVKLPKHTTGNFWFRVMKAKTDMLNPEYRPGFNVMFSSLESNWRRLLFFIFASFFAIAAVLAGLFWAGSCSNKPSFGTVYFMTLGQLVTGPAFIELTDIDPADQETHCLFLGYVASLCTLTMNAFILSLAVRKFMKPKVALMFSKKLAFNSRNGQPCLQARLINLRGTLISDAQIRARYCRMEQTSEGEQYFRMRDLEFNGGMIVKGPSTFTHVIEKDSPLYDDYTARRPIEGVIIFQFTGYDHVLHDQIHQIWMFELPRDAAPCSRFADVVIKGVSDSVRDGSFRMQVDMSQFNAVVPVHGKDRCCLLCSRGCPFGSDAARKIEKQRRREKRKHRRCSRAPEPVDPEFELNRGAGFQLSGRHVGQPGDMSDDSPHSDGEPTEVATASGQGHRHGSSGREAEFGSGSSVTAQHEAGERRETRVSFADNPVASSSVGDGAALRRSLSVPAASNAATAKSHHDTHLVNIRPTLSETQLDDVNNLQPDHHLSSQPFVQHPPKVVGRRETDA